MATGEDCKGKGRDGTLKYTAILADHSRYMFTRDLFAAISPSILPRAPPLAGTELNSSVPGQQGGRRGVLGRTDYYGKKTRNDSGGVTAMELYSDEGLDINPEKTPLSLKDWVAQVREMDCFLLVV